MPQSNDYLFNLKHRLVGAAVLIVAAIIILPLALTGQKHGHRHASMGNGGTVAPVQQTFISRINVNSSDVSVQQSSAEIVKDDSDRRDKSDTGKYSKEINLQVIDENRSASDSVELRSGWVVRVGVFQIPENAKKRQSILYENGFDVKLKEAELDGKAAIWVFLGPFSSKDEAERMKAQAVMVTNEKAFVARYP